MCVDLRSNAAQNKRGGPKAAPLARQMQWAISLGEVA